MSAPDEVARLADERASARADKDFAAADELRNRIAQSGWRVVDVPDGWRLEPAPPARRLAPREVVTVLQSPPTFDVTVHWVCEGWPEDVERAIAAFRAHEGGRRVQYVVADVSGEEPDRWGAGVEVVSLEEGTGWGAARNAGLRRTLGRTVLVMDGSVEPSGDVLGPLEAALEDPALGVCGPFGLVTTDLRQFDETSTPGPSDAVEGYLMALRREVLVDAGLFDERFRWYRSADIDYSFRVKETGMRTEVVPVPVVRHEHRMWHRTPPPERARWSKRNFYRFLDRWRDRWDLVASGPPHHAH